jgi:hypothetical protein
MLWSFVHRIAIRFDLCFFAKREWETFATLASRFRIGCHAGAIWIPGTARPVYHVFTYQLVEERVSVFVWYLTGHYFVHKFGCLRLIICFFHNEEEMHMR